ncbi:MAG: hypothetical protein ACOCY1_03255 [Halovenus sp.]
MSMLPSSYDSTGSEEAEPRVVDVESEEADEVFDALASAVVQTLYSQGLFPFDGGGPAGDPDSGGGTDEGRDGDGRSIETADSDTAVDDATETRDGMDAATAETNISDGAANATDTVTDGQLTPEEPQTVVETAASLPPGLLFFLGGVFALCLAFAVFYYTDLR